MDWFPAPAISAKMLAVQLHKNWETQLLEHLSLDGKLEVILPGPAIEHTRILFCELELPTSKRLVEELGRLPRFAVMGISWYKGAAIDTQPFKLPAFIRQTHYQQHALFLFWNLLAALWEMVSDDIAL